ncbi:DUF1194 domain-containing protein [Kiloniella sp.]|uniref:DUF1194 domain-containing protein n=1 Tax=Kiloniella sp. TaxID=1938587 RepID=UPI003B021616
MNFGSLLHLTLFYKALILSFIPSFILFPLQSTAEPTLVDLELVLAVDVSHSVDDYEASLQRQGYIDALRDPAVIRAISSGPFGRIAVTYIEWAGEHYQRTVIDWTLLEGTQSANAFADRLSTLSIGTAPSTSISRAIDYSINEIFHNDFLSKRAVIDISGDGPNSDGRHVTQSRNDAIALGITINGLPILSSRPNPNGLGAPSAWLGAYYSKNVIGGENAFLIEVFEFETFSSTLKEKLKREIKGTTEISLNTHQTPPYERMIQ